MAMRRLLAGFVENAYIGTEDCTLDNHCAVDPDSVSATMALTATLVAMNIAAMAIA
jgi:hypothetical protein